MSGRLPTRRAILATSAAASLIGLLPGQFAAAADDNTIRPFSINVPEADLVDLRRRIAATRWPDRETVKDQSQGVPLAKLQELVRYWGTDYDWRKVEAKLNALPQFVNDDRRRGYPLHSRSLEASQCVAAHRHSWLAGVGHRAAQDH